MSISFWPAWITPSHRLHGEANCLTGGWGADLGALEVGADGDQLLGIGLHLAQHVAQLCLDFLAVFLAARDGLLAQFGNGTLRTHRVAQQLSDGGVGFGHLSLEFELTISRRIAFGDEATGVPEFLHHQRELAAAWPEHALVGLQQCLLTANAFFDALQRGTQRGTSRLKELALGVHLDLDQRIGRGLDQVGMEAHAVGISLLCFEAALHRTQAEIALAHRFEVGACGSSVEFD